MTTTLRSVAADTRRKRRIPSTLLTVFHHKRLVVWMGVLGSVAGLAISSLIPKVYYARTRLQIKPDSQTCCGSLARPPTFAERMFRHVDSAATRVGLPNPKLEERMSRKDDGN